MEFASFGGPRAPSRALAAPGGVLGERGAFLAALGAALGPLLAALGALLAALGAREAQEAPEGCWEAQQTSRGGPRAIKLDQPGFEPWTFGSTLLLSRCLNH